VRTGRQGRGPIQVHALLETLAALRSHIFNGIIWPDFTRLPSAEHPILELVPFSIGEVLTSEVDPLFNPWIRLIGPTGVLISSATGALATLQVDIERWAELKAGAATLVAYACPRDLG